MTNGGSANFDTYCGYSTEFLFLAGVKATCDYLEQHEITEMHPLLCEMKPQLQTLYTEEEWIEGTLYKAYRGRSVKLFKEKAVEFIFHCLLLLRS